MKRLIEVQSIKGILSTRVTKVALAMVIFISMIINGIVPRAMENKESIASIIGTVINNVIVDTFRQCNDTLTVMSNKITRDLYKYLRLGEVGTDVPVNSGQKEEETPVNTSSDSGIEIESREYRELVGYSQECGIVVISEGKVLERLYRLYNNVKVYCSGSRTLGVLFFIMFVVVIRDRKEDIEEAVIKNNIEDKTNLCR